MPVGPVGRAVRAVETSGPSSLVGSVPTRDSSNSRFHTGGGGDPQMVEKWCLYVINTLYTLHKHP